MPSTSDKQRRFMEIAAHDPKFAASAHIPQTVAEEFYRADQAKKGAVKEMSEKRYGKKKK